MPMYYIFVRAWPNLNDQFPYERFENLPDSKIMDAVHAYCIEVSKTDPDVARARRAPGAGPRPIPMKQGLEYLLGEKEREPDWEQYERDERHAQAEAAKVKRRLETRKGLVEIVAGMKKWKQSPFFGMYDVTMDDAVMSPRFFLKRLDSRDMAQRVVTVLRNVRADWNPRFGMLAAEDLSQTERDLANTCIFEIEQGRSPYGDETFVEAALEFVNNTIAAVRSEETAAGAPAGEVGMPLLSDQVWEALRIVLAVAEGDGIMGDALCTALDNTGHGLDGSSLRTRLVPLMKAHFGLKNKRGVGYHIPSDLRHAARELLARHDQKVH